jgi:hypothetical protein
VIVNHVWSEENLNINAHGLSSSFNVNRDKNKSKYMSVNLIHGEALSQEEKVDFFGESRQLYRFSRFFLFFSGL